MIDPPHGATFDLILWPRVFKSRVRYSSRRFGEDGRDPSALMPSGKGESSPVSRPRSGLSPSSRHRRAPCSLSSALSRVATSTTALGVVNETPFARPRCWGRGHDIPKNHTARTRSRMTRIGPQIRGIGAIGVRIRRGRKEMFCRAPPSCLTR